MSTSTTEENGTVQASAACEPPKPNKKAHAGARRAHVARAKPKSAMKASEAKKTPKGTKKAAGARDGSKAAKILDLLKRPDGATVKELMKCTGWKQHSLRGFLSGTVGKKMGLTVSSTKSEDGVRSYTLKS
jgi:hypothetical protein